MAELGIFLAGLVAGGAGGFGLALLFISCRKNGKKLKSNLENDIMEQ